MKATGEPTDAKTAAWNDPGAMLIAVVESSNDAIIATTLDNIITSWNNAAQRIFGYTAREIIGRDVSVLIPDDRADEESAIIDRIRNGVRVDHYETQRRHKEGHAIHVSLTVSPVKDARGNVVGVSKIARDITEQKREHEVRARLAAAAVASGDALVTRSLDGTILEWSESAEHMFGFTRDEAIGRSFDLLVPAECAHAEREVVSGLEDGRPVVQHESRRRRKDGAMLHVSLVTLPIRDKFGRLVGLSEVTRDISRERRADERFRHAVESAPNAMIMVDGGGKIVLVNAQTEKLFGYAREELIDATVEMLVPMRFREAHDDVRAGFFAAPHARPMGAGRDLFAVRKDGSEVPVEIGLNPIRTEDGVFVLAAVVDITERKHAHVALAQKNEEVEAFVYIVSHDLRTPLVNLQGFSNELEMSYEQLKRKLSDAALPPEITRDVRSILEQDVPSALRYISASTHKFERLINALLELSRSGRREFRRENVDVRSLLETTLDSVRRLLEAVDAEVRIGPLPRVWADSTALGQVFANLVTNALSYRSADRRLVIEIGGDKRAGLIHYWVGDNGVGIPAVAQDRIFQVFQRLHPELASGDGMGLALIKRIVERNGGMVRVESEEGVGSTFHFSLPSTDTDEPSAVVDS